MIRRLPPFLAALAGDRRGAIAPTIAVLSISLLAVAGLALDVGLYQLGNRDLRAATEAAAMAAAMNPAQAETRARDYLTRNGYDPAVLRSVTIGRYCANGNAAADQRFKTDPGPCANTTGTASTYNAVRVQTGQGSRRFMTGILGGTFVIPDLAATATAARIDEAGLEISTGLLDVTNSLVTSINDLLGALIGVQLRLSTADIQALAVGNVDAGLFFDKLAHRVGHTGTYGELAQGTYTLQDIALSAADAAAEPATATALRTFGGQVGAGYRVPLKDLFGLGVWKNMPVGEGDAKPALRAGMNAYQLMSYAVQAGPTAVDLSAAVSSLVPVSTVKIGLVTGNVPNRPRFSFGPVGDAKVFTSALRLRVLVDLPIDLGLASVKVHLPVLIDVAAAEAGVSGIDCANSPEQNSATTVTADTTSGLVNAYIGDTTFDPMTKVMPSLGAGDIQNTTFAEVKVLGLPVTAKARAIAQPVAGAREYRTFGPGVGYPATRPYQQIGNQVTLSQTVRGLTTSLVRSDGLSIEILNYCAPLLCSSTTSLVRDTVLPAVVDPVAQLLGSAIDPLLNNLLAALGIQLGSAFVRVNGARCGVPVLV